jgi:hypothetical protein
MDFRMAFWEWLFLSLPTLSRFGAIGQFILREPQKTWSTRVFCCPVRRPLWHTSSHGKQRQRQEGSKESAEAQAKTGTRSQTRGVHASPAEVKKSSR